MHKSFVFIFFVIFSLFFLANFLSPVFPESAAVQYMCELGVAYYRLGRYDDALSEFKKVLLVEPGNPTAQKYTNTIFQQDAQPVLPREQPQAEQPGINLPQRRLTKEEAVEEALRTYTSGSAVPEEAKPAPPAFLSGYYRLGIGLTPEEAIWKDANADKVGVPHEKNWRYLWGDEGYNTYDRKIYDRLTLNMQTDLDNPLNAFVEFTIDPWTFIGKNDLTVQSGTDSVDLKLKYWSSTSSTINETYRSDQGQIINLKEIKVSDGKTKPAVLSIVPTGAAFGSPISPIEISRDYRPIRKVWLNYQQDDYKIKVFPLSDQFEALTSDDPLRISNNRVYWEESPWLDQYEPSRVFNSAGNPIKRGRWIRSLSFFTKDSSDDYPHRLTFLRGASLNLDNSAYTVDATLATPMTLWDNYGNSNSVHGALKAKVPLKDNLDLGFTATSKVGLHGGSMEALNQVEALDLAYALNPFYNLHGEIAESHTDIQEAKGFNSSYDGLGAKLALKYKSSEETKEGVSQGEVYGAYMDNNFYPALSNYRYTRRDDPTFSRHIYFADIKDDDWVLMWGDGMDRGRMAVGFNLNTKGFDGKMDTDIQFRNVRKYNGSKYVESVLRGESTYEVNPQFTSKLLAYYQNLPKTHAGYDPLMYVKTMYSLSDYLAEDDSHPLNSSVVDGKDPSIGAFGWGGKYDFMEDQLSLEAVYERTNDPGDFPRSLLNDLSVTSEVADDQTWDKVVPFLYDTSFFGLPPYRYYNIAKTKFIYKPDKEWEFILGYAFNENKYATGIDDNINHIGFETTYTPTQKWTLWFKYIYSKLIDIYKQNQYQSADFYEGHNNFFFGSEYKFGKDEVFTFLYGEFVGYNDPYQQANWSLSALDTQHIFRLYYRRKF